MLDLGELAEGGDEAVRGVVVVVDVLRAFSTAAIALARGAREIWPVATVAEAYALRDATPGALIMGEVDGLPVAGFDLGNSPAAMRAADVEGRVLVQRTSAGTQGVVRTAGRGPRFAASFLCARATVEAVAAHRPDDLTFVITGRDERDGDEDLACAEYLAGLLTGGPALDPTPYLRRVPRSTAGRRFVDRADPQYCPADLDEVQRVDDVGFALRVQAPAAGGADRLRITAHHPTTG
jgi:2-phosphosulfolactate phosphatase